MQLIKAGCILYQSYNIVQISHLVAYEGLKASRMQKALDSPVNTSPIQNDYH